MLKKYFVCLFLLKICYLSVKKHQGEKDGKT